MQEQVPLYQDMRWLVTTGMAVTGLLLSIYNIWVQSRLRSPKVRVLLQDAMKPRHKIAFTVDEDPYDGVEQLLTLTIKNYGYIDMTFGKLCCELELKGIDKGTVALNPRHSEPELPATIKHGQSIKMVVQAARIAGALNRLSTDPNRKVRLVAKDAISRQFYSDWRKLTIAKQTNDDDE